MTSCDECGRDMASSHRVHAGVRYCTTCYARCFKRRLCGGCGMFARLLRSDADARCTACENAKPCARCGKENYAIGKITPYGPVCNACRPYFVEPKPCDLCGTMSRRLSRYKHLGHDVRACPKCGGVDVGSCQACRRSRPLQSAPDGRLVCKKCLELGEVTCTGCGQSTPAGGGDLCMPCARLKTLDKRLRMNAAAFETASVRDAYEAFGRWLPGHAGPHNSALKINRYLGFFLDVEKAFGRFPEADDLIAKFGAERLRRFRLVSTWLKHACAVAIDPAVKQRDSDRRRIEAMLGALPAGSIGREALSRYSAMLEERAAAGRLTIQSMRLALRPALSLLQAEDPAGSRLPSQTAVDRYLADSPGQLAALTGFVNFLGREFACSLAARTDDARVKRLRRKRLEAEIGRLARADANAPNFLKQWVYATMAYFHPVTAAQLRAIDVATALKEEANGWNVAIRGEDFWIPRPPQLTLKSRAHRPTT